MDYRIIDAHAHIFPAKIAAKATVAIGEFYDIQMDDVGNCDALVKSGEQIGCEKYLVCSTATKPEQVEAINDFIIARCKKYPSFMGLATFHPNMQNPEKEIERVCKEGVFGFKLHPDFQEFNIDDEGVMPVYKLIAQTGKPILFHTGDKRYDYSAPFRLRNLSDKIPTLKCIGAHLGGYANWETAWEYKGYTSIYFDTSSSLDFLPSEQAVDIIRALGTDRVMFGSDFPMWKHAEELERFLALQLDEQEKKQILYDNFAGLFL